MDDPLNGVIGASVVCVLMLVAVVAMVCFMYLRHRSSDSDGDSQNGRLIKGHSSNGGVPSVAKFAPYPVPPTHRSMYPFPTVPSRHMATYRPRCVEDVNPTGMQAVDRQSVIVKSQTFNGPYTHESGPVVYDVRQHRGIRPHKSAWSQQDQEEAVATMTLGEEGPEQMVPGELKDSVQNRDHTFRESVKTDVRIPSPDSSRREYLFKSDTETPRPPSLSASSNGIRRNSQGVTSEADVDSGREVKRESSRRQRKAADGSVLVLPPNDPNLPPADYQCHSE